MKEAYELYSKWLRSMMYSLKLDENQLSADGRKLFDNIIGKKNK